MLNKIKFHLMRSVPSLRVKKYLEERTSNKIGKSDVFEGESILSEVQQEPDHLRALQNQGFCEFGEVFNEKRINALIDSVKHLKCFDPFRQSLGAFDPSVPPAESHVGNYRRSDLVKVKPILDIANDPYFLNLASEFLGARPTISNVNMWWSYSGHGVAEQAQNFHRDFDDIKFCKLFLYLTDVNTENGPHVYVKGSSNISKLLKIRRYTDDQIAEAFGAENIIEFTRPKGSMFMVDTYGFHKGLLPKEGKRLIMQVQYSLGPILIEDYKPEKIEFDGAYDSYVNRLILNQA
ncbi:phytanoyl-CoA dioxygenase family protein [Roseivirga pacifica]|uniref:phytanoyl-CoA dioxygenase family protein n=1 Tax=Roseivirga pacifica TaxID=1267423 RepID=UPI003BAE7DBD